MLPFLISLMISLILPAGLKCQGPVANFPVNDCNVSKKCVGSPDTGCLQSGVCRELLKYSYNPGTPDKVRIELFGVPPMPGASNFWIAVGLNPVGGAMAGTLVSECVFSDNGVNVFTSYNSDSGYVNQRLPQGQENYGISEASGTFSNGILSCMFSLDVKRNAQGHDFNLNNPLYLVLGDGPARGTVVRAHLSTPWTSNDPYILAAADQQQGVYSNLQSLSTLSPVRNFAPASDSAAMTSSRMTTAPASIDQCGLSKGCLTNPPGCLSTGNCQTVVSYQVNSDRPGELLFELWRSMTSPGDQYVAVGLNPISPSMADTGVVACVYHTNSIDVLSSYNPAYYTVPTENSKEGITVLQTAADNSHLYCQFSLQTKRSFRGSFQKSPVELDINDPMYLMLAHGPARPNGQVGKHSVLPMLSTGKVSLATVAVAAAANTNMYKAHGGLMVAAWMFLASIGIFTARYYKTMWLNHKPCGLALWFHIHRPIMLLAVSCAIAGFVIIFVFKAGRWTQTAPSENPHPIIGIIAFILGLVQPIMAFFRPHPGTTNRPIFNWAHFLVGFSAHIMAIAAIFLGVRMPQMKINDASTWIMVAFSAFHALWLILLQLIDCIAPRVKGTRTSTMQMKTVNGNGVVFEESVVQAPEKSPASKLKTIMWFSHFIVVGALTIAILVLIGISP